MCIFKFKTILCSFFDKICISIYIFNRKKLLEYMRQLLIYTIEKFLLPYKYVKNVDYNETNSIVIFLRREIVRGIVKCQLWNSQFAAYFTVHYSLHPRSSQLSHRMSLLRFKATSGIYNLRQRIMRNSANGRKIMLYLKE